MSLLLLLEDFNVLMLISCKMQGCQKFGFCPSSRILRCLSWDSDGHLTYFSSIRISLINARERSRNPDPDIRSHVRLEGVHIAYMNREDVVCDPVT